MRHGLFQYKQAVLSFEHLTINYEIKPHTKIRCHEMLFQDSLLWIKYSNTQHKSLILSLEEPSGLKCLSPFPPSFGQRQRAALYWEADIESVTGFPISREKTSVILRNKCQVIEYLNTGARGRNLYSR